MRIDKISIVNFKNIRQADLKFSPNVNALIGNNGEGKTNLLDALFFLSFTKSNYQLQDSACITHGESFFVVQGSYIDDEGLQENIYCGLKSGGKKVMRRNDKAYKRLTEHIGLIPLVMVSPSDQALVVGGSEERRRLIDRIISQYDHEYMNALLAYNKALQQRNALLKLEQDVDESLMSLWEEEMAHHGTIIYKRRCHLIELFEPVFQRYYQAISNDNEKVTLSYTSHGHRGEMLQIIQNGRTKDRIMGYSLHGVHRDDLEMNIGGFPLKREGSQGQSKTFLVAMKFAQFEFLRQASMGVTPILLLDDIFDKLDSDRVERIVNLVATKQFGQIFITDTNREHLDKILNQLNTEYKLFHVSQGEIN